MKPITLLSLLALAACGGGGNDNPDAANNFPDAGETPDSAPQPDAEMVDAGCTTDPACLGATDGEIRCVGNAVVTCSQDGACLSAAAVDCTNTDVCIDDGTPACEANGDGEACAAPQYIVADTTVSGADFTADYADDQDFTGAGCQEGAAADANVEALFAVNLGPYQGVTVSETGGMDAILGIQRSCGNANACLTSADDPETVSFVTEEPTTIFIYVGAHDAAPAATDYSIDFAFTSCGDGTVDAGEICDDGGNGAGDGCSPGCRVEWGWTCDDSAPTACTALPDLGTYGGGETITKTEAGPVAEGESIYYTVTFTEPVRITGSLTATAGDPDWYAYAPATGLYSEAVDGDETIGDELERYFTAGTYVIEVNAYLELTNGFTLTMDTVAPAHTDLGSFAAGDTIDPVVNDTGLTAGASEYYTITFTDPVVLSGSLAVTSAGDADLYWWEAGNPVFTSAETGDETITDQTLAAGTYYVRPNAYFGDVDVDGYTLTLTTAAVP
ncbi:MAG TPA: hypothetical protein VL172_05635 [Kofleriaceae bacterium]|nr:hypothetical protein [Kofleriaceae bacterium]